MEEYLSKLLALFTAAKSWLSWGWAEGRNSGRYVQNTCLDLLFCQTEDQNVFDSLPNCLEATIMLKMRVIWPFHLIPYLLHELEQPHRLAWLFGSRRDRSTVALSPCYKRLGITPVHLVVCHADS